MGDIPKGSDLSNEELADLIRELADLVSSEQLSFDPQAVTSIQEALVEREHTEGLKLISRISLLANADDGRAGYSHDYVQERTESTEPIDPEKDSEQLRQLAQEIESDE